METPALSVIVPVHWGSLAHPTSAVAHATAPSLPIITCMSVLLAVQLGAARRSRAVQAALCIEMRRAIPKIFMRYMHINGKGFYIQQKR
jgi:hypothetical protein